MSKGKEGQKLSQPPSPASKIDALMDKASRALVARRYFEAERLCLDALQQAHGAHDFERMGRIILPLQEARRQKRQLAGDAGSVFAIDGDLPAADQLKPGCYLVKPPRVGLDGRLLRQLADQHEVPVIVLTREPTNRLGLWPIVSLGPVTIRALVKPPDSPDANAGDAQPPVAARTLAKKPAKKPPAKRAAKPPEPAPVPTSAPNYWPGINDPLPGVTWFMSASEALGDAALAAVDSSRHAISRVEDLMTRLTAHPDHEKLHQALRTACEEAARAPAPVRRPRAESTLEPDEDPDVF